VDLESKMLESVSFEFNVRHPLRLIFKILQIEFDFIRPHSGPDPQAKLKTLVTSISVDLNYTFSLLKQTTSTLAIACVELALRLQGRAAELEAVFPPTDPARTSSPPPGERPTPHQRFGTTRAAVSETLLDLLDLYATHRALTCAGAHFGLDDVTAVRLRLNELAEEMRIPRFAAPARAAAGSRGGEGEARPASAGSRRAGERDRDGASPPAGDAGDATGSGGGPAREAAYAVVLRRAAAENARNRKSGASPTSPAAAAAHADEHATNGAAAAPRRGLAVAGAGDVEPITPLDGNAFAADGRSEGSLPRGGGDEQAALPPVRRFVLQNEDAVAEEAVLARYFVPREQEYEREEVIEDGWETDEDEEEAEETVGAH
jgi:hypothetical protein